MTDCASTWLATFTLTAGDPYEYGEAVPTLTNLGGVPGGDGLIDFGQVTLTESGCPAYDYSPIYDPLYPALVASPTAPDFYPAGWGIYEGMTFDRYWARVTSPEPSSLLVVPVLTATTDVPTRMVRVSIWDDSAGTTDQCGALFTAILTYLPDAQQFVVDGEQKASYVWDGFSPNVRRSDSLVYGSNAVPVEWVAFNADPHLLVTLDVFSDSSGMGGDGTVGINLDLVPKSD